MVKSNAERQAEYMAKLKTRAEKLTKLYMIFRNHAAAIAPLLSPGELEFMEQLDGVGAIRPHPSMRAPTEDAMAFIQKEIPPEAEISKITFDFNLGEVTIAAKKPGLVVDKDGFTLKSLREKTLWLPNVVDS